MKASTATLKALFSQENDTSFSLYLNIQTDSSKKASDLFTNLNTGDHMLAALALDASSEPIVILDAELSRRKASLLVLDKDLELKVVLLEDSTTLDKTEVDSNISVSVNPSYFQAGATSEAEFNAEAHPICLFPSEWIGLMIDESKDSLSLSEFQVNLMAKLSNIESIQDLIPESSIIKNLCTFFSLEENDSNSAQLEALKLGPFARNLGNSQPVKSMKAKLEDIKNELLKIPNTDTMENSIRDSILQHRQGSPPPTSPPPSAEEKARAEAEAKAKAEADLKAKAEAEAKAKAEERARKRKERDELANLKDDSDSNSDEDEDDDDSDSDLEFLGNKKATPSKFDSLNQLYSIDKFTASNKTISRNLKRQKLIGENGVIQSFIQSNRIHEHLAHCTSANGKVTTELNDTFTQILTCNKEKRDIARAMKQEVKLISSHLGIEGKIESVCNKTAEYFYSGEPFVEKDILKEEDLIGFSFMSVPIPNRSPLSKNGSKYYIPKTVEDLIFQLKVFIGHLIILFAKKPDKELKGGATNKQSGICVLARNLLQQVIDTKSKISATFEKHTGANFDVARRLHNKFIQVIHSHVTQRKPVIGAKLTCKVIEDISESDYRPPYSKPSKPTGGDGKGKGGDGRGRGGDGRGNGGGQAQGYFFIPKAVFKKALSNKDKIPKFDNKQACLKCAKFGTGRCRNPDNDDFFHGPYGQRHEPDLKAFGDAIGSKITKYNRRG